MDEQERLQREEHALIRDRMVTALLDIPELSDRQARLILVELVGEQLGRRLSQREQPTARLAFLELVRTCERTAGGLDGLAEAVRSTAPDSPAAELLVGLCEAASHRDRLAAAGVAFPGGHLPPQTALERAPERAALERIGPGAAVTPVATTTAVPAAGATAAAAPVPAASPPLRGGAVPRRDFFLSYTGSDRRWAEWIAWVLEEAGYQVLVQAWDFVTGTNWNHAMQQAVLTCDRTIALVSPDYLLSVYSSQEWQAALRVDPSGLARKLVPIRVAPCEQPGLLAGVISFDLFGLDDERAREVLLAQIRALEQGRAKPNRSPEFPGPAD
jgi:hypothetical protein